MGDDRPSTYMEGDVAIFRASAVGHACVKSLVAHRLGYTPLPVPQNMQDRYDEGTELEPVVIERLAREYGWMMSGFQEEFEIPVGSKIKIRLHPDAAFATHPESKGEFVLEVKNFGEDWWEKWKRQGLNGFVGYQWQISLEMAATGRMGLFVVAKKFSDEPLSIITLEEPPIPIGQIKAWVAKVELEVRRAQATGVMPDCDKAMWPCPFLYLHEEKERETETDELVDAAADFLDQCRKSEKAWKEKGEKARERLLEVLAGRTEVSTKRFDVKVGSSERSTFDRKRFEKDHPVLAKEYVKTTPVERVDVKAAE